MPEGLEVPGGPEGLEESPFAIAVTVTLSILGCSSRL
jgi:hypothetical protein